MASRRSVSPAVMRRSMRMAAGFEDGNVPRATLIPTRMRHAEMVLAITLWLGFLPVLLFASHGAVNCIFLVLVVGLTLHAYSMRPYCTEFSDEEEDAMIEMYHSSEPKANVIEISQKEHTEQRNFVFLVLTLASTLGATIALTMGGGAVLRSWIAPIASECSVNDLHRLEGSYERFSCKDGFLDLSQQRSFMTKSAYRFTQQKYSAYRIVPIFAGKPDKTDIPVAWAVSKNQHMSVPVCAGGGLCGLYAKKDATPTDLASYDKLKQVMRNDLIKGGAKDFEAHSIPIVILTNLIDPEGKAVYFIVGSSFYCFVLIGITCVARHMYIESPSKLDSIQVYQVRGRSEYDPLTEGVAQG